MNATDDQLADVEVLWDLASLRRGWGWLVTLGAILALVGTIALASQVIASVVTMVVIGRLLLLAGIVEILGAYWIRRLSDFFLHLLSGALLTLIGALFVREPVDAGLAVAMLLAGYWMIGAIFRVNAAATYQYTGWGWGMLTGSIELVLGTGRPLGPPGTRRALPRARRLPRRARRPVLGHPPSLGHALRPHSNPSPSRNPPSPPRLAAAATRRPAPNGTPLRFPLPSPFPRDIFRSGRSAGHRVRGKGRAQLRCLLPHILHAPSFARNADRRAMRHRHRRPRKGGPS